MQQHQFHSSTRKKRLLCSAEQIGITSEASNFVGSMCGLLFSHLHEHFFFFNNHHLLGYSFSPIPTDDRTRWQGV